MGTQFVSSLRSRLNHRRRMLRGAISLIYLAVSCKATSEPLPPPPPCYAEDGYDCIFPFVWKGQAFSECTLFDSSNGKHWCATKTDRNGNHVNGQGNYGFCDCSVNQCGCYQIPNDDVQYSDAPGAEGRTADIGDPVE